MGKTWDQISAGAVHLCGVTTTGEGLCWGDNSRGATNVPAGKTWAKISPGAVHTCGITISGEGLCWGAEDVNMDTGQANLPPGKTWASISGGLFHTCGVTTSGEGLCWGANSAGFDFGQTTIPTGLVFPVDSGGGPLVWAAPRLTKVDLKVNLRTKVTTLTLRGSASTAAGSNSVSRFEYSNHEKRPAANAIPQAHFVRNYATTVVLPARQVAFWVRVKDAKGKWSIWYRTRFKPSGIGW